MLLSCLFMGGAFLLMKHRGEVPVPLPRSLAGIPRSIGAWEGTPLTMSRKEEGILNADDYALLEYSQSGGGGRGGPILFYTAYYEEQTPEKNIHSPKNCLPGAGWAILRSSVIRVLLGRPATRPVGINLAVIQKGLQKQVVLYWYQERGRIFDNEYWGRLYLIKDAILLHRTDGALVRISMPVAGSVAQTVKAELKFARNMTPILARYIPGRVLEGASAGKRTLNGRTHAAL